MLIDLRNVPSDSGPELDPLVTEGEQDWRKWVWDTKDGRSIPIHELETSHIRNILARMEPICEYLHGVKSELPAYERHTLDWERHLKAELEIRKPAEY